MFEGHTNVAELVSRISKDYRRLTKIAEDCQGRPEDVSIIHRKKDSLRANHDISEVINIFTSEDMENTPPESRMNFTIGVFSS